MFRRALFIAVTLSLPACLFGSPREIIHAAKPVKGEYFVRLSPAAGDLKTMGTKIARAHGGKAIDFFPRINTMVVLMTAKQAEATNRDPLVSVVEENSSGYIDTMTSPQTGLGPRVPGSPASLWGLDHTDRSPGAPRLDDTYRWNFDGTGSQIYVVDTGVLPYLPEFGGPDASRVQFRNDLATQLNALGNPDRLPIGQCWNGGDFSANATHGTSVASIAAGDTFGMAKQATIVDVRSIDCGGFWTSYRILKTLQFIDTDPLRIGGKAVINMSFSGALNNNSNDSALVAQIQAMAQYMPIVIAAGNNGLSASGYLPANAPGAIVVGGINQNADTIWFLSNYGAPVSVYAPAEHIESSTTCTPAIFNSNGVMVFQGCNALPDHYKLRSELPGCGNSVGNPDPYGCTSGTSFAAAIVSGMAARRLQWYYSPNRPPQNSADFNYDFGAMALAGVIEPGGRWVPILNWRDGRF